MLGLHFCARAFSSCGKRGPLFIAVRGPLTIAASLVVEHRLQTRRLSSCGSRAQLLGGMWDLPRLGLEPVSPALAGRFSTTVPPGKPRKYIIWVLSLGLESSCNSYCWAGTLPPSCEQARASLLEDERPCGERTQVPQPLWLRPQTREWVESSGTRG